MQLCPAKAKAVCESFAATSSMSASASTSTGVAFPSSSLDLLLGRALARFQPTPLDPVNVMSAPARRSRGVADCDAGRRRRSASPAGGRLVEQHLREQERGQRRLRRGLQHDRAARRDRGGDLVATRLSGKLNGLIAPTTPTGMRSVKPTCRPRATRPSGSCRPRACGPRPRRPLVRPSRPLRLDAGGLHRLARLGGDRVRGLVLDDGLLLPLLRLSVLLRVAAVESCHGHGARGPHRRGGRPPTSA